MTTEASDALIAHVGTIAQHRAKQLTEAMVAAADLVLAATRDIRADIVRSVPNAVRRTFTVREFARLAALMPDDAVPALSGLAAAVAAERVGAPDADDDVADPIGKPARDYVLAADVLNDAVTVIARALRKAWSATSLRDSD
jgi:protein-tyrosine phosphatase